MAFSLLVELANMRLSKKTRKKRAPDQSSDLIARAGVIPA
jgi:hypothetical protein